MLGTAKTYLDVAKTFLDAAKISLDTAKNNWDAYWLVISHKFYVAQLNPISSMVFGHRICHALQILSGF